MQNEQGEKCCEIQDGSPEMTEIVVG